MSKTEEIMGLPVDNVTYESILADVPIYFQRHQKLTAVSVNPQIALESQNYPEIVSFIKEGTHRIPDGIGIVIVSKLLGGAIRERITGIDLMERFLVYANQHQQRIFLVGAKSEVIEAAAANIAKNYPKLTVCGYIDGYTTLTDDEMVRRINSSKPDFLFVGMGFPRQEQWLARNLNMLSATVYQNVGGSFDVMSGFVKRAPAVFVKLNLEWLYRSCSDMKRLYRIGQLPVFVVKSILWKIKNKKSRE